MSLCPEHDKRAAMTDAEFWQHVLLGDERAEDTDEPDPNEPWDTGLVTGQPCSECGESGACAYDSEGRAMVHVQAAEVET